MTSLYSARFHPAGVLLLKFDRDLNHEASYLVSNGNCECPAASRPTCRHRKMLPFFEKLPPCLVGAEACGTSHHWARELTKLGHEVRLMPALHYRVPAEQRCVA